MKKKLLILGSDYGTLDTVRTAQEMGLYVVVTDTMSTSPTKRAADEAWMISTTDIDTLEAECRRHDIAGIAYGASDFNINNGRKLCKRLGLPVYCEDDRAWEIANNKSEFKKVCRKVGAPVAKDYYLNDKLNDEEIDMITFPVVVKPVDKSGNRGMSYCYDKEQLKTAWAHARSISDNPVIVVERMLKGPEYAVNYVIADGEPRLLYFSAEHHQPGQAANLYSVINTQPLHLRQYLDEVNDKVIELLKEVGCREGVAWVECMRDEDGKFYLLEMGYRYGGEMTYVPYKLVRGFDTIKWMIEISMGQKHQVSDLPSGLNGLETATAASYYMFSHQAGTIERIDGLEKIESLPGVFVDFPKREGNQVRGKAAMGIIRIYGETIQDLVSKIRLINENLRITDKENKGMFIYFDDYGALIDDFEAGIKEFC
ncbi:MAG: ATP-grasp domain-containing protein [Bacteroidales bacterium]|nr:ATP-grasp domain-containing protein [Bacteroidales bacterium]